MPTSHGRAGVVKLGAAGGTNILAEVTAWTMEAGVDITDDTVMGDTYKTHIPGMKEWSGSIECWWDESDTNGQVTLDEGASVTLNLYPDGTTTGKKYITGTATITKVTVSSKMDSINARSFQFQGNGAYTWAAAP